jgi:hypothetical protein
MQNPTKQKITDLKFTAKRLEVECLDLGMDQSARSLAQAILIIEEAIKGAELIKSSQSFKSRGASGNHK